MVVKFGVVASLENLGERLSKFISVLKLIILKIKVIRLTIFSS